MDKTIKSVSIKDIRQYNEHKVLLLFWDNCYRPKSMLQYLVRTHASVTVTITCYVVTEQRQNLRLLSFLYTNTDTTKRSKLDAGYDNYRRFPLSVYSCYSPPAPYNLSTIPKRSSLLKAINTKTRLKKNATLLNRNTGKYKEGEGVTAVREIARGQTQRIFFPP
jgi:hypothetical protein